MRRRRVAWGDGNYLNWNSSSWLWSTLAAARLELLSLRTILLDEARGDPELDPNEPRLTCDGGVGWRVVGSSDLCETVRAWVPMVQLTSQL